MHHSRVRFNCHSRPTGLLALQTTLLIVNGLLMQSVQQYHLYSAYFWCYTVSAVYVFQAKTDTVTVLQTGIFLL